VLSLLPVLGADATLLRVGRLARLVHLLRHVSAYARPGSSGPPAPLRPPGQWVVRPDRASRQHGRAVL